MAKRLKVKFEVEFECPDTCKPEEAFYKYFNATRKVENATWKLLSSSSFATPSKENKKARAHNEARRILKVILDLVPATFKINRGFRSNYDSRSGFSVNIVNATDPTQMAMNCWFTINGSMFNYHDRNINLADPDSMQKAAELVKCAFKVCGCKNKGGTHP